MSHEQAKILPRIEGPHSIKHLSMPEMAALADEVRQYIIETVSDTGGHLAPNLGVVELTLALHRVFDSPRDQLVWDVGHQCYTHKIITGRCDAMSTLRQPGGISGFPKRNESAHDVFETGHSSTSVASALGLAVARDLRGDDSEVVAIIGDGALTGGLAYEGLNNTGDLGTRMTVVLNDNSMSIAPNVGAMSQYLARVRSDPTYNRLKEDVNVLLKGIPRVGKSMVGSLRRVKGSLKYLLLPGILFEELGFTYLGPVDGHDIQALTDVLKRSTTIPGPVLVHVLTVKGKGYPPAERHPEQFHGVGAFDIESGATKKSSGVSYTKVFSEGLLALAEKDSRIVGITAAMREGTGLDQMAEQYPDRYFDVGIAEGGAVTFAAGLAAGGQRPVVAIYSTFMQRAFDQVVHDVAHQKLPVIFAIDRAGIVGADGDTHQGALDIAMLRTVPHLVSMAPRDENMLRRMLVTAHEYEEGPVSIRFPRGAGHGVAVDDDLQPLSLGTAEPLAFGGDGAIIAIGHPAHEALKAHKQLLSEGLRIAVLDARFIKPLDRERIVELARIVPFIVTVEEGSCHGGFGSAVLELLTEELPPEEMPKVRIVGLPDVFIPHGDQNEQRREYGLTADGLVATVRHLAKAERTGFAKAWAVMKGKMRRGVGE